ncbi:MAG: MFS transporter [Acidobacteriota bacterium]
MASPGSLATIFLIVFTDLVGFGIVIPLLPLYAETMNPSPLQFGLLMASFSLMQLFFAPLLGRLSDRVGRRPVLLVSLAGAVVGYLLFAVADSFLLLLASRIVAGVAGANIATAQAVIADVTPPEQRTRGMGLIGAAFGLGFIAGPALAGVLVRISPAAPGIAAAAFSATAMVMTVLLLPESLPPARRGVASQRRAGLLALRHAWRTPALAPLLAVALAVVTGFAAFEVTFAQLVYRRFGLHAGSIAFLFAYAGLLAAVMQMTLVGRLSRRLGERRLLLVGLAGTAVGLLLIASQHSLPALIAVLPVLAFGQAMVMPSLSALVSHTAPGERQGETLGAYQATSSLARVLGPMAGQLALGHLGLGAPALTAAACALAAAAIAAALPPVGPSRLE